MMTSNVDQPIVTQKKQSKIGAFFNRFFHFYERGSTMKNEIVSGISVFLISVCVLLMNTQIMGAGLGGGTFEGEYVYTGAYLGATIISFVGTIVMGLICNLPLVQDSSLGLSTVFISTLGMNTGLTYANLLLINFVSAIVYLAVTVIPVVNKFVTDMIPSGVRKALPVGVGIYVMAIALNNLGILSFRTDAAGLLTGVAGSDAVNFSFSLFDYGALSIAVDGLSVNILVLMLLSTIGCVITVIIASKRHGKHPYLYGFLVAFAIFYVVGSMIGATTDLITTARVYQIAGESLYSVAFGAKGLKIGNLFVEGGDFSAFTAAGGSVASIFIQGILLFLFMGLFETRSTVEACALYNDRIDAEDGKTIRRVQFANAITNVMAPIFGSAPVSAGKQSVAANRDGGKTGLTALVCAIGFLIAIFTWEFFAVLATSFAYNPEYSHEGYNIYYAVLSTTFGIADAVMLCVGASMLKSLKNCDWTDMAEFVPFIATFVIAALSMNIVYGVAFGVFAYLLVKLASFNLKTIKSISIPSVVLAALMIIMLVL